MGSFAPRLIPRKTLQGKRLTQMLDSHNLPLPPKEVEFTIENAGVQPVPGYEANALPSGWRDRKIFKLFTTTKVEPAEEGTDSSGDLVEVVVDGESLWCRVMRVKPWTYGIQSHYEAVLVHENER